MAKSRSESPLCEAEGEENSAWPGQKLNTKS